MSEKKPRVLWCWHDRDKKAVGPFDTREDAIEDAEDTFGGSTGPTTLYIDTCRFLDPADYVCDDLDWQMERMDENAYDTSGVSWDDAYFEASDEARGNLREILRKWATDHVVSNVWTWVGPGEQITVGLSPQEAEAS